MYSFGSLAPKIKRGGGCMDSHFHKPAEPWEKSEGWALILPPSLSLSLSLTHHASSHIYFLFLYSSCVHLLAELSKVAGCNEAVSSLLPVLADTTRYKQYRHHYNLFETVLKQVMMLISAYPITHYCLTQIPVLCKSLGKRIFKRHIELFFDPLFYSIVSPSNKLFLVHYLISPLSSHLLVLS